MKNFYNLFCFGFKFRIYSRWLCLTSAISKPWSTLPVPGSFFLWTPTIYHRSYCMMHFHQFERSILVYPTLSENNLLKLFSSKFKFWTCVSWLRFLSTNCNRWSSSTVAGLSFLWIPTRNHRSLLRICFLLVSTNIRRNYSRILHFLK